MKRNKIILLLATALMIAVVSSCKKDVLETSEVFPEGNYQSLQDFYEQNGAETQNILINDPEIFNVITGQMGTQIQIPANSLRDSAGFPPPGSVNVTLREVYNIKDMVLSHLPTTSDGNILQSGGMFYLEFSANNIRYQPNSYLLVTMPGDSAVQGMQVFFGLENQSTGINWALADSGSFVSLDSAGTNYIMYLDSLGYGWINCDQLYPIGNPTDVTITPVVDAERNETVDIAVYLLFPSINSVMNVSNTTSQQNVIAYNIPIGMQAVAAVIGVGRITKKAYFGKINFTVTSPQNVSVSVMQMTDQQIFDSLSNL